MLSPPRIVIVGAGISGLAIAYRLQDRLPDASITILERADRPGGTTWTVRDDGFQVETGPNGFLDTKPSTLNLCRDVGLGTQLVEASDVAGKNRYLFLNDRLKALPGGLGAFLGTDLLSWRGKLSLLWERFRKKKAGDDDESIDAFARRRAGDEAADVLADALVTGIYAGDPKLLSLPACFPRIAELERVYGSVIKGFAAEAKKRRAEANANGVAYEKPGKMWSLPGGLRGLIEAIVAKLRQPPIYSIVVGAIHRTPASTWQVQADGRDGWEADAVVLTCPAHQQSILLADIDSPLAQEIGAIAYNRVAVVALGYRRSDIPIALDGFGYIAPENTRRDLLGVQWCSSIYPSRAPAGCVLLRAMAGGWQRPEIVDWDDARLLQSLRAELRLAMNITAEPMFHRIIRWPSAIPQYHVGHLQRVARIDDRLKAWPGLWLGGNAYRGVALNDCTEQGLLIAENVVAYLSARPGQTIAGPTATKVQRPSPLANALALFDNDEFLRRVRNPFVDCSQLAHELQEAAGNVGGQINISPAQDQDIVIHIVNGKPKRSRYHVVYTDGEWVFDPRRSNSPIARTAYENEIKDLNGPTVEMAFVRSNQEDEA